MGQYLEQNSTLRQKLWHECVIGLAIVSKDGDFLDCNAAWCNALKYTRGELLGKKFADITHPEDLQADFDEVNALISGNTNSYNMRKRYITKPGDIIWVDLHVEAIRNDGGIIEYFLSQIEIPDQSFNSYLVDRLNEVSENRVPPTASKGTFIKSILEKNFKWIVTSIILGVVYTGNTTYNAIKEYETYQETKQVVDENSQKISDLIIAVESIVDKLPENDSYDTNSNSNE